MQLFTFEHGRFGYMADLMLYALTSLCLWLFVLVGAPPARWPVLLGLGVLGLLAWTLVEYLLHRFVMHRIHPFRRWHLAHHARPVALISSPTWLTALLFLLLVFLPAQAAAGTLRASALTAGLVTGYLGFSVAHHAMHHWRANGAWLTRRKYLHTVHHRGQKACCYGVTTELWDRVFGTAEGATPGKQD